MKNIILILVFLLPLNMLAQNTDGDGYDYGDSNKSEMSTLFGGTGKLEHGGYGGPAIKVGNIEGATAVMLGAKGGWVINHTFTLGIAGYGLVNAPTEKYINVENEEVEAAIRFGYGGFFLEYIHNPNNIVHFTGTLMLGWGGMGFDEGGDLYSASWNENNQGDNDKYDHDPWVAFFIVEPSVGVELNITSFFKLGAEASYRFSNQMGSGNNFQGNNVIEDYKVDGFSGSIVFKFGVF